jgi:hypothetical protein
MGKRSRTKAAKKRRVKVKADRRLKAAGINPLLPGTRGLKTVSA